MQPAEDERTDTLRVAVGAAQTVTVVLIVLGWVLATAVIAAFAGVLRRGD